MKRIHIILLALIIAALLATGGVIWAMTRPNTSTVVEQLSTERHRTDITYTAKAGETSLDQLKREVDSIVTKQSDYGEYVDTIEGYIGGTDGKYWSFYVDGTMSAVGAGSYIQKGGETIQWKFQKL